MYIYTWLYNTPSEFAKIRIKIRQIRKGEIDMIFSLLKWILAVLIVVFLVISMMTSFDIIDQDLLDKFTAGLISLGALLMVVGILSNIIRHSKAKLGTINRAEFYGGIVILVGFMFTMNQRIDTLFTLFASK